MEKYKGKLTLGNKEYECEVIDGVRYIDGKTVDEFYNELPIEEVIKAVIYPRTQRYELTFKL